MNECAIMIEVEDLIAVWLEDYYQKWIPNDTNNNHA